MRHQHTQTRQVADDALQRVEDAGSGGGVEPKSVQLVYVATSGSDQSGNGSFANPFQTISHAETSITDAGALKPYVILVAPGIYPEAIAQKSFVSIEGVDPSNPPRLDGVLSFAVGFVGGAGLANLEFTAAQNLALPATDPTYNLVHNRFDAPLIITGAAGGSILTVEQNAFGQTTFTDIGDIRSRGNTYGGSNVFNATTVSGTMESSGDSFRNTYAFTATAPFVFVAVAVGSQANGALDLTGAGVTFRGTAGAIPPAVGLAGGAPAPTLLSSANGMSYLATTVANWSGVNPTSVQNALDRIAAKDTPIP
jgi:hypothetical protein